MKSIFNKNSQTYRSALPMFNLNKLGSFGQLYQRVRRVFRAMVVSIGLLSILTTAACAQTDPIVKVAVTDLTFQCEYQNYKVGFILASTTLQDLNTQKAKAFGVILFPESTNQRKVFCLYNIGGSNSSPTYRDDDNGNLNDHLINYNDDTATGKKPTVIVFFNKNVCIDYKEEIDRNTINTIFQEFVANIETSMESVKSRFTNRKWKELVVPPNELETMSQVQTALEFAKTIHNIANNIQVETTRVVELTELQKLQKENIDLKQQIDKLKIELSKNESRLVENFLRSLAIGCLVVFSLAIIIFSFFFVNTTKRDHVEFIRLQTYKQLITDPAHHQSADYISERIESCCTQVKELYALHLELIKQKTTSLQPKHQSPQQNRQERKPGSNQLEGKAGMSQTVGSLEQNQAKINELYKSLLANLNQLPSGFVSSLVKSTYSLQPNHEAVDQIKRQIIDNNQTILNALCEWANSKGLIDITSIQKELNQAIKNSIKDHFAEDSFTKDLMNDLAKLGNLNSHYNYKIEDLKQPIHWIKQLISNLGHQYRSTESLPLQTIVDSMEKAALLVDSMKDKSYLGENRLNILVNLLNEQSQVLELIQKNSLTEIKSTTKPITKVITQYMHIGQIFEQHLPGQEGTVYDKVARLIHDFRIKENEASRVAGLSADIARINKEKSEALNNLNGENRRLAEAINTLNTERTAHQTKLTEANQLSINLAMEISNQLNFNINSIHPSEEIASRLLNLLRKENSWYPLYRIELIASIKEIENVMSLNRDQEQSSLIQVLSISSIKDGLNKFLNDLENFSQPNEIWEKGLYFGFSQNWIHYLLRADLILKTYYKEQPDFKLLQQSISLANSAVQIMLRKHKVIVEEISLLVPPPPNIEIDDNSFKEFRSLKKIQEIIKHYKLQNISSFVIDVIAFPYTHGGKQSRGKVIGFNASDWPDDKRTPPLE